MCSTGLTYSDGTKGPPGSYKLLFVALNLKTRQDYTHPYASSVGVVEDRSVLMGLPDHSNGPGGSYGPIVV